MICTCEKCKSAFFTDTPPLFCPNCSEQIFVYGGVDEMRMLANLLASGRVKESREFYDYPKDPKADEVPPLMDVVERMDALLDQIPEKTWKKYRRDYYDVKNFLATYHNGFYYENQKKRGVPKIETTGMRLYLSLHTLLTKIEKKAPSEEPEEPDIEAEVTEEELDEAMKKIGGMDRDWVRSMLEYGKRHGLDRG